MMPSPLQPFVSTGGKRGFSAFDSADGYGAKRACGGFQGPAFDIENMAPPQMQQGYGGAGGFCSQMPQQFMVQQSFQHPPQQHGQHGQHAVGDSAMECSEMSPGDGMDMDSGGNAIRYERFPSKNVCSGSPTHYHKSTAIGYIPPLQTTTSMEEECMVRTWECQAGNDYY